MGNASYSSYSRSVRSSSMGYATKSREEIFTQQKERRAHEQMDPRGVNFRECRDSETHPESVPIQLYLDVTGSMLSIPDKMIKDGLPTMMSNMIQNGVEHASVLFGAIGDHECDRHPLQVGQFESGDAELDMWLTRTYLEAGGGGNMGESYPLAWYFAANHTVSDSWEKRNKKGFVFTIGDEPFLDTIPFSAIKEIMGETAKGQGTLKASDLYKSACQKNHVYHIFLEHGGRRVDERWKELMGENLIVISDYTEIPNIVARKVLQIMGKTETSETFYEPPSVSSGAWEIPGML